ncbi:MAG: MBL fold metallo-hydrolase [Solirubrobacterales bacterium]|nr:MBL fold metallo-hydrolase [Solirubrobacterales bacterium]
MSASVQTVAPGLHRIEVPTPFRVGPVNAYLVEDEPLTLVDNGPNSATSLLALESGLNHIGYAVADLELLVVTHQHVDHHGLTSALLSRSGAELAVLDALAAPLAGWPAYAEGNDALAQRLMCRHGVPEGVATVLRAVARAQHGWGGAAQASRLLVSGERLELHAHTFEIIHAPGHSPSDTLLWDARERIMLGGDHLLEHISSNPIIALPLDESDARRALDGPCRPHPLPAYLASLRRTRSLRPAIVLGGHGPPVRNVPALIDERLRFHARRAEKIHSMIVERPRAAHEVARAMWGERALTQAFLTLCEVLGHVDLLAEQRRVLEVEEDAIVRLHA